MAVPVKSGDSLKFGAEVPLFEFRAGTIRSTFGSTPYAVTADGQRFLINEIAVMEPNAPLTVMINWTAGMKKEP